MLYFYLFFAYFSSPLMLASPGFLPRPWRHSCGPRAFIMFHILVRVCVFVHPKKRPFAITIYIFGGKCSFILVCTVYEK